ncbi:MAG: tetratricopeptide repeat protein [Sphingobacteriales bacterium]
MKKVLIIFYTLLFLFQISVFAQKPIDEEKVKKAVVLMKKMMEDPGQMQAVLVEIEALKLNSAEDKEANKRFEKELMNKASEMKEKVMITGGITEKQITEMNENKDRIVPVRDDARINAVLKRNLSDGELKDFCRAVHEAVKKVMNPAAISQAEAIYSKMKAKYPSTEAMGNGAISCYLYNLTQQSIYIMGKVCSQDAGNANNLNNYAALLTNHGVEQGAIPILNYLHRKYARSPVILSNLSAAWMGLGEFKTAEKYADSCIKFFPGNAAQAHYVKSVVKESEGNRQGAIEELKKSIGESYSSEKANLLKKMGGELNASDYKKTLPADALGLSKFGFPELPKSCEVAVNATQEWDAYNKNIEAAIEEQKNKTERLKKEFDEKSIATYNAVMNSVKQKSGKSTYAFAANNNTNRSWDSYFKTLSGEFFKKGEIFKKELARLEAINKKEIKQMDLAFADVSKRYQNVCGEGQNCPETEICRAYQEVHDQYMLRMNSQYQKYFTEYIDYQRKKTNELVYAGRQFMEKEFYEYYASLSKLQFLGALKTVHYKKNYQIYPELGGFSKYCINVKTNPFTNNELANWNDLNCNNRWEMTLPFCGVATDCDKITFKFDVLFAEGSYSEDLFTGEWTNMTLEVGVGIGSKKVTDKLGVEIGGAEVEIVGFIEIDRSGTSDYGGKVKAAITGGEAVPVVGSMSLIEAEGKISLKSGKPSFEVKSDMSKASVSYK